MKFLRITCLSMFFALGPLAGSGQKVDFSYDASGNRTDCLIVNIPTLAPKSLGKQMVIDNQSDEQTLKDAISPILYRELKVYPNPTLGQVKVELPATENDTPFTYRVLTATGQVIMSGQSADGAADFDLSAQPVGIYFVTLRNANTSYSLQIVKQ